MEAQPLKRFFTSPICQSCRWRLLHQPRRPFATTIRLRAQDDPPQRPPSTSANPGTPPRQVPQASSLFQNAGDALARQQQEQRQQQPQQPPSEPSDDAIDELIALSNSNRRLPATRPRASVNGILSPSSDATSYVNVPSLTGAASSLEPFVLHITTHKHNTHLALTGPFPPKSSLRGPHDRRRSISMSAGNIGFRKSGRGTYDAAFQLAAFVFGAINERDILPLIQDRGMEVRYRGFGKGREAVTKALLGQEGRWIRGKVVRISDVTALKFGGVRSRKPRRLG